MAIEIGHVEAIFRYPVKSMGGERLDTARLGWHGLEGDRRLAFRRIDDRSGFPWLSASKLPELLLFSPQGREDGAQGDLPTHVRTPDGEELPVFGQDLATEVGRRLGAPVQMMQLKHGIFDEASISVIASETVREIGRLAGQSPDVRRFRPNVVVRLLRPAPFLEDEWVGGVLSFGQGDDSAAIAVTMRDVRCSMVNLDPHSAKSSPEVLKAVVRANQNNAGIYGAVTRIGRLAVGQTIRFCAAGEGRGAPAPSVSTEQSWPSAAQSDPFARDSAGRTALFYAAEKGDLQQVRRIIFGLTGTGLSPQRLALIERKDSSGLTAIDVAKQAGHQQIADLLRGEQMRMEFFE